MTTKHPYAPTTSPTAGKQRRPDRILLAAERLARIFVRMFGAFVQISVLVDMVRQAGMDYALEHSQRQRQKSRVTLTELSLITGLDTRTVKKMRERPKTVDSYYLCAEAAILERWSVEPAYRDPDTGEPADLPIFGADGSFQGLVVRLAGRGVSTRTVLHRLEAAGNIETIDKHFVRLVSAQWRSVDAVEERFLDTGSLSMMYLANTIQSNLQYRHDDHLKRFERRAYSVQIAEQDVAKLKGDMQQLLQRQHGEMMDLLSRYENPAEHFHHSVGAGYYLWHEDDDQFLGPSKADS